MPYLSKKDRQEYAERSRRICPECKHQIQDEYCSRCDEFYPVGHSAICKQGQRHRHTCYTRGSAYR